MSIQKFLVKGAICDNYGHDDFTIGLLRDTTPHVDCYDDLWSAQHPFFVAVAGRRSACDSTNKEALRSINHHNNQHEA